MSGAFHRRVALLITGVLLLLAVGCGATNATSSGSGTTPQTGSHIVDLSWNPSTSQVAGYNIYRQTRSGNPVKVNSTVEPATTFSDSTVSSGQTYSYFVTAVGPNSVESSPSNEVTVTIPTP